MQQKSVQSRGTGSIEIVKPHHMKFTPIDRTPGRGTPLMISPETDFMDLFRGIVFNVIGLKKQQIY